MAKSKHHRSNKHSKRNSKRRSQRRPESQMSNGYRAYLAYCEAFEKNFEMMPYNDDWLMLRSRSTGEVYFVEA